MAAMQFWGVEVKGKESTKVTVEEDHVLHLSQATLGELKKDGEPVTLYVKVDDKKLVLGILSPENNPQLSFDLVFEKDFEISHNWKNGSVHLLGYQSEIPEDEDEMPDFSDDDEGMPVEGENGSAAAAAIAKAIAANRAKINQKKAEAEAKANANANANANAKAGDEDDDSDDDEDSEDDDSDEDMADLSDDSDDDEEGSEDDDEESSEEETPVKAESGKKRKPEAKTPEPKKAKLATPQKTDGKKGGHSATPHPKKGGKTPGGEKSPKSGSQVSCGSCKKTFNSEVALQSHTKAKHSAK